MTDSDQGMKPVERLRLGTGFHETDRGWIVAELAALGRHLDHWVPGSVDIRIAVKGRDSQEQRITLEIWLPHRPPSVVHVSDPNLDHALIEARRRMVRELAKEAQTKRNGATHESSGH